VSVAWSLYRAVASGLGALAPAAGWFTPPVERLYWGERLGRVEEPGGCHAWIHAASLGETVGVAPFATELRRLQPGARLWFTATTVSGRGRLEAERPRLSLAPMDAPQTARRFFHGVQPKRLFLIETELWPQWLMRARREDVPVAVVSARLSARSTRHYLRLGRGFRELVSGLSAVLCQTPADAERWLRIGAPGERTAVVGNLKNDGLPVAAESRAASRAELGFDPERPLMVLASLRPGEARWLGRMWSGLPRSTRERWQVVAVPRHPRASGELLREARDEGVAILGDRARGTGWRWDARLGVLARYYAVADLAVVGGSLHPYGGHNPLEPAACGVAVAMGPHFESQRAQVKALSERSAILTGRSLEELRARLTALLANEAEVRERGATARAVVAGLRGAARRSAALLTAWRLWPAE
jgi:3-deoxy-D-manno-octulosonic-acid transferase